MKILRFLSGRIFITSLLILIQCAWLVTMFLSLVEHTVWISTTLTVLSLLLVLHVIKSEQNPAYKIGWILILLLLPIFGGLMYLLAGNKRPALSMRLKMEKVNRRSLPVLQQEKTVARKIEQSDLRMIGLSRFIAETGRFPAWENTQSRYFPLGEELYAEMLCQLEKAEKFIFLEYFIIHDGKMWKEILDILERKAAEGVDVRLIYDDFGSSSVNPKKFVPEMEARGIRTLPFNPVVPILSMAMNHRDHRKILVIDGHTAFTGGVNLADEYINAIERFGHWKDIGVMLHGEAVWNFTVMFLEMWNVFRPTEENYEPFRPHANHPEAFESNGIVQPFADSPLDGEAVSKSIYMDILAQARRYVYIFTPYLIIDSEMQQALCMAVRRGVDVRIVTPGIPDKKIVFRLTRSYYEPLLKSGVRIYEYAPGFMHGKCIVSDDNKAVVGSINMDFRSLYLHFECGTLLYRTESIMQVKRDVLETLPKCREAGMKDRRWSFWGSLFDAILRAFSPLF